MPDMAVLMKHLTHGVYVVGVSDSERRNAFTAAWVMQASFNPPLLVFSINPQHYSYQILQAGGVCSVNVLRRGQMQEAVHFGSSGVRDKMDAYQWTQAETGAPILSEALAYFDCKVSHYCAAGDHQLAVCEVVAAGLLNNGAPLLYIETGNMDGSIELYKV